ncbi:MAG: polysaccharide export outer membrane protein [Pseudohongiellaceae bacterium]|jgi:polysaccharide export outer membrane protein
MPNDIVYVPDDEQRLVTVIGQVHAPAMIPLHQRLDLLAALTYAGSMTENALRAEVRVVRPLDGGRVRVITIDVERIYNDGAISANIQLQPGDTVFVPERGLSKFNYVLRQISPGLSTYLVFDSVDAALNE